MTPSFLLLRAAAVLLFLLISTLFANSVDPPLVISVADACARMMNTLSFCASEIPPGIPPVLTEAPVTFSGTYTPFPGVSMTVSGLGQAGYGVLKADTSASFDIAGTPVVVYSYGASAFRDVVTIDFAPWNGSSGLLFVSYALNGTIVASGNSNAGLNVETYGGPTDSQIMFQDYASSVSGLFTAPAPINFIYGQPFNLGLELWAEAGTQGSVVGFFWNKPANEIGSASANFSNTLILVSLVPTDVNGNQAVGAQFFSASGTQYSQDGVLESFANLSACTELEINDRAFETEGSFLLGPGTNGIAPLTEDVTLQVGTFSATIPGGSFSLDEQGRFAFHGVVNGAALDMSILPIKEEHGGFKYRASGWHANLSGTSDPVTVRLIVGDDGGKTTSSCGHE